MNEDRSKADQFLFATELFDKDLNPYIKNNEKISPGNSVYRYFSSEIIVRQFRGFICSPFSSRIDNNHLVIRDQDITDKAGLQIFINLMFTEENNKRYKFCKELIKCLFSEIKYVVFHVTLHFPNFNHANIVIIDKSNSEKYKYFIFEPHGYNFNTDIYGDTNIKRKDVSDFILEFFDILKNHYHETYPDRQPIFFEEVIQQYTGFQKEEIRNLETDSYGNPIKLINNEGLCVTHVLFFAFIFFNFVFGEIRRPKTMFDVAETFDNFFKIDREKYEYNTIEDLISSYSYFMSFTGVKKSWIHETLIAFNSKITEYIYTVYLLQFYQYLKGFIRVTRAQVASKRFDKLSDNIFRDMKQMKTVDIFISEAAKQYMQQAFNILCEKFKEEEIFTINGINFDLINTSLMEIDNIKSLSYKRNAFSAPTALHIPIPKTYKRSLTRASQLKSYKKSRSGTGKKLKIARKTEKKEQKKEKKRAKKTEKKNRKKEQKKAKKREKK
jgi:hypothetical protein